MTIKEIEERTGMDRANIRFYEKEGLLSPERLANGYRDYTEQDVIILLRIKLLRSLHIPLDDIRALQYGEKSLEAVMCAHLNTLENEKQAVSAAEDVCRTMRDDRAVYETLDAAKYLNQLEQPKKEQPEYFTLPKDDTAPYPAHPWRRLFARALDYDLYLLPLELLCLLALHINPNSAKGQLISALCTVSAYLMMLFIEPALLHFFGTTPGKWLFGLRITTDSNTYLTYEEGLQRTWNVIRYGYGYGVPFYEIYRHWQCYKLCIMGEPCPWDEFPIRRFYTIRDTKAWRSIVWFCAVTAIIFCNHWAAEVSALPPNRGDLTVAEFAENFNYLRDYYATGPVGTVHTFTLAENGAWQMQSAPNGEYIYVSESASRRDPIPFEYFTDADGSLTGFGIKNENGDYWELMDISDFECAALAYITAQPDCTVFSRTTKRIVDKMERGYLDHIEFTECGVQVTCTYAFAEENVSYEFVVTKDLQS